MASGDSLSKTGYVFDSWNTDPNGTGTKYTAGSSLVMGAANVNLYANWVVDESCTCLAGQYKSGASCVDAENGFWAASCTKTACTNKPANSSYLGTGASSQACPWTCDNNYVPNSSFTGCDSNSGKIALACAANQLMVGLSGRSGGWLDKVGVRCQEFSGASLNGAVKAGLEYGGEGGGPFSQDCPSGYAVYKIEVGNKDATTAGVIRFWCRKLSDGSVMAEAYPSNSSFWGETYGSTMTLTCNSPYYMNWFTMGSAGTYAGAFSGSYGCRSVVPTAGLIGYWQFDNSANDSSGNSNNLTGNGTVTFSTADKKFGSHGVVFDGSSGYYDAEKSLLTGLSAYSIAGWVMVSDRGQANSKISFWGENDLLELGLNTSAPANDICFWVTGGSDVCSTTLISTNSWYHVVVTVSASGTKLYLNGVLEGSKALSTVGAVSTSSFKIGAGVWNATGDFLKGAVDDVIIYNRELTATEVQQIYGQ